MPVTRLLAGLLVAAPLAGQGQTIADYGRAQRELLQATMAQNAARAAAITASSPLAPPAAGPAQGPAASPPPVRTSPSARAEPSLGVSGVFVSAHGAWAEIEVEGRAWRLSRGDEVPGTSWRVASVSAGEVLLDRPDGGEAGRAAGRRMRRFVLGGGR